MKLALCLILISVPLMAAGPLAFGVMAGVPLQDLIDAQAPYQSLMKKWTIGPVIDLDLPKGIGVEMDLLWRGAGYRYNTSDQTASSWEFPLMLKYKFPGKVVRPFLGAGITFRHLGDLGLLTAPGQLLTKSNGSRGFVFGGGLRFSLKLVKLAPQLRYTHWDNSPLTIGTLTSSVVNYRKSQVEFLIGLTF